VYQSIWSVFGIGGTRSAGVTRCRRSAIQPVQHASERADPTGLRLVVPATGVVARERAGERGDRRQGQAGPEGGTAVSHHRRVRVLRGYARPGQVIAPGQIRPRTIGLLSGVCGPAGYRRAAAGIGWPQRLRRASRDEGAWPRATR